MTDINLRPAKQSDAADLALLDNIAGHGISLWYWQGEVQSGRTEHALALGRSRMAGDELISGWKNSVVAIDQNDIVTGAIASYLMPPKYKTADEEKTSASAFVPVFELFDKAVGTWIIDSLAIYPEFQGRGIGRLLLEDSMNKAREASVKNASLVMEDSNINAMKLYESLGFKVTDKRGFIEFDGPSETKEWLFMSAKL